MATCHLVMRNALLVVSNGGDGPTAVSRLQEYGLWSGRFVGRSRHQLDRLSPKPNTAWIGGCV